jgi:1-acyl-sn-glycerol-3-phosphate acyltransferase
MPQGGSEPIGLKWKRRAKTIPAMIAATVVAVALSPVLVVFTIGWDLVRRRWRFPTLRIYAFICQYLLNDSVEILLAGPLWLAAGFGSRLHSPSSRHRHQKLQAWSIALLARRAEQLLGVRFQTDPDIDGVLAPGPAVVVCRHVSLLDASLPSLLYQRIGYQTRGVIMAELLADPGFDLLYQRAGSVFIVRDSSPEARHQTASIGEGLNNKSVAIIFPEGRLFRPEVLQRSLERLAKRDPARARNLKALRHMLPPRPGGLIALLDALPAADVVVVNHAGLDRYPTFAELARRVPLRDPIEVRVRRIERADIPEDRAEQIAWLDGLWREMDRWVDDHLP